MVIQVHSEGYLHTRFGISELGSLLEVRLSFDIAVRTELHDQ